MKLKFIILLLLCFSTTTILFAQSQIVKGRIVNEKQEPIAGANILEIGKDFNGTSSDENGNFQLKFKGDSHIISVSFVGYITQLFNSTGLKGIITIKMAPDQKLLDEVVVVGFGRQKRITNTGAVSSIKSVDIQAIPTPSLQNTLVGRLPGFFSQQRSGQPGSDAADFFIRGVNSLNSDSKPLIIVDDIEYTYDQVSQINANEIETITILKDAATTAIYGLKGANGVLVITTMRGKIGKPRINFTAETGINRIIRMPTFLDSYSTALLRNEAMTNESYGLSTPAVLPFSVDDLMKFKDGTDPYGHPNVDWANTLVKRTSLQSRYNVDISGGNSIVKYFTSMGYYSEDGNLNNFAPTDGSDVNNNYYYRRINFRSNLDITPTKTLKLRFDINGRFQIQNSPQGWIQQNGLFYDIDSYGYLTSYSMPLVNPNGTASYGNDQIINAGIGKYVNPITRWANAGYSRVFTNNINIVAGAEQQLNFITKGLSVKLNISYAPTTAETRSLTRSIGAMPAYLYNPLNQSYTIFNVSNPKFFPYSLGSSNSTYSNTTIAQGILNYDRTFGQNHVYALGLINQRSIESGAAVPVNYRGMTLRLGYDYKQKYMFEFNIARNGNDLFRPDQQYGIFPAISAGWNLSEEKIFHNLLPAFDLFKIRGSYGLVGSDVSYPSTVYNQVQYVQNSSVYGFGNTSYNSVNGYSEGSIVNPFVTWEKERKTDIGLDINILKGKISFSADYFYNFRYDQYISQGDVSSIVGQSLPSKNIGQTENSGFDGILTYKDKIGKVNYSIGINASFAKNKIIYVSEAPNYPYQARTGQPIGSYLLYHFIGFYLPSDFDASGKLKPTVPQIQGYTIQPGDLKYQDTNGDGQITTADKTYNVRPNLPTTTGGINLSVNYKGISISALIQGAFDYQLYMQAAGAEAFASNLLPWHFNSWTPANAENATYPRMGVYGASTNANNNSWNNLSDFWAINAGYIRLKSLEIGWQLPEVLLKKVSFIHSVRIYGSGYNLLNFNKMKDYQQDAEISSGQGNQYPNTANFNFGVQIGL